MHAKIIALLFCGPQSYAVIKMEERKTRRTASATDSKKSLKESFSGPHLETILHCLST